MAGKKSNTILVTGGLGFIGSHTVVELIEAGYNPVIVDTLENAELFILDRIAEITGKKPEFIQGDCRNESLINALFEKYSFNGIIHFAAYKAVGQSVKHPENYFDNNLSSLWVILRAMKKYHVPDLVFSSSCTVYGNATQFPVTENTPLGEAASPYGYTKQACEKLVQYFITSNVSCRAVLLRYFNPIGAHSSAKIGELPIGVPDNLIPYITQTVAGLRKELTVFGNDYNTPDGSCIRDYIHVSDLAQAHVEALKRMNAFTSSCEIINLGTGHGNSVLEVIQAFEKATGKKVPYKIGPRREGDIPVMYASVKKANELLQWKPKFTLEQSLEHAWKWQLELGKK